MKIKIETIVYADPATVWAAWTTPDDISQWNAASDDWHTPRSSNDLWVGGQFSYRMEAKDGSMGFDFAGIYTKVVEQTLIEYTLGDARTVAVEFVPAGDSVKVIETFEAEDENSVEMQRQGWQNILNNFKRHVESKA
ncbi:MAG: SRPBCC family protein [Caldilineaceae bacterium]|nr:SRPBCC family protein [Caldilineaceae bacterium]